MAKILIAGGGTGGHFYPALALGLALKAKGHLPLFLIRKGDPAFPALEALHLPSVEAELKGLPRTPFHNWPAWLWGTFKGFRTVRYLMAAFRPDVMVGTGSYLTLPAALFAGLRGVPVVLHESNARLGLANRLARPWAARLALGLPLPEAGPGARVVGTPVRERLLRPPPKEEARRALGLDPRRPVLLVAGGSQGAAALNRLALEAVRELERRRPGELQALLLCGRAHEDAVRREAQGLPVAVRGYLEEMELAYAAADAALCRAGASTVAELIGARLPALLVPYPHAAGDHQTANARVLEKAGAARLLPEGGLNPGGLAKEIETVILSGLDGTRRMREAYASLPPPAGAAEALLRCVEDALNRPKAE